MSFLSVRHWFWFGTGILVLAGVGLWLNASTPKARTPQAETTPISSLEPTPQPPIQIPDNQTPAHCPLRFESICSKKFRPDPTGRIVQDSAAELAALRLYRKILHSNPGLSMHEVDALYVEQAYSPKARKRLEDIFSWVQKTFLTLIESNLKQILPPSQIDLLTRRIQSVELQLPPPAEVYEDERDLFTRPVVLYKPSGTRPRIRVGGAYPIHLLSFYNIVFTLGHELAHSIDPCELALVDAQPYFNRVSECFIQAKWLADDSHKQCGVGSHLAEVYADFWATHLTAIALNQFGGEYSDNKKLAAMKNSIGDLCGLVDEQFELDFSNHPPPITRVGKIFIAHPTLPTFLSCATTQAFCSLDGRFIP